MTDPQKPLLYSFRRCPYAMRARWALLVSGKSCVIREIVLRDKPEHMLEISPKGTVPVLMLPDGEILEESFDIMRWALGHNDPESWLKPQTGSLDEIIELVHTNDNDFKHHLDRYKYPNRYENVDGIEQRTQAEKFIQTLEDRLNKSSFLFGDRRSLADAAILPFIRQFINTDKDWFAATKYLAVQRWAADLLSGEDFGLVMKKYALYGPDTEITFFPPT